MKKWLWLLVLVAAGGDIVTTVHGLNSGEREQNPVIRTAIGEVGVLPALFLFKLLAIVVALVTSHVLSSHRWVPPAALLLVWAPVTLWNIIILLL